MSNVNFQANKTHGRYDRSLKRELARRYLAGEFSYRIAAEELRSGEVVKQSACWKSATKQSVSTMARTAEMAVSLLQELHLTYQL